MTAVKTLHSDNFQTEVLHSPKTAVVDFWAAWCGPCRMISPLIEEMAADYQGRLLVGKLNVDENRKLALDFGVTAIPTVLVFKGGEVVERVVGYRHKDELYQIVNRHL
ncbi:MAG: thioredoxin [Firmicutes bacterium]|nr:thioredoxin [Bacillota bacterium]